MEIKGVIKEIHTPQVGESPKGKWQKQIFIIETISDYPKEVAIIVWNEKVTIPPEGTEVSVFIDIASREWKGNYYTDVTTYKVVETGTKQQKFDLDEKLPENDTDNDLPF